MEFGTGKKMPLWAFIFTICCIQQKVSSDEGISGKVTIIPPITTPVITSFNQAHNGQVCSTWGNFHFKTFDRDIFYFPGLCNYVFASHCNTAFEDFNIQIRRTVEGDMPSISYITMRLDGVDVQLEEDAVEVNGERVELPYSGAGFLIEKSTSYVIITAKLGLNLMWNEKDSLMLELDKKYANQTCGLCGDFNGIPTYNEFISDGVHLTDLQFGNMQKLNGPTEECEDPIPFPLNNCTDVYDICRQVLTGSAFSQCNDVVWVDDYIDICVQDLCLCNDSDNFSCLCQTFAEYSRQCDHAGGQPQNWRTPELCPMGCPFNMEYQECGSPCMDTCTNSERSQLCEDHCMDGCFCPPGTVYDDISGSGCVQLEQCSCIYNGKSYAPGATYSEPCRSCLCAGGQWDCTDVPCPGICSVEGGSHISTYDEKHYDVHGDCTYVLSKTCDDNLFTVLGELRRCGLTETETCLKMVTLNINGGETNVVIKPDGDIFLNWIYTQLPISTANVTIFSPSSFYTIVQCSFGLQLVIQHTPMMQVYMYLDPSFKERTCGLCGNFDSRETDDFKVLSGVVEGTAATFANTWKTQAACPNIKHTFEDPCTLSIVNEKYASHWCGLLTDSEGPFAECHSAVNAAPYHKNCMFDTCNCERSEDCMCAALSSYVRACAAKKIELPGWRTTVCTKYTTCAQSLNYSYAISSCQPTCRSLSEPDVTCNIKFVPVDGCTCESGTYLDSSGKCVPAQMCPCYYKGNPVLSGEVLHDLGAVCTCSKGKLNCIGGGGDSKSICVAPMVYFDCKNATAGTTGAECQKSCQTLDMHCYSTQCVSGCMCPSGLVSDGNGGCIPMEECPCVHNDVTYKPGEKIKVDCNTCVCKDRMWKCTKNKCLATCAVYGDGHYITFDDKRYIFNGKCEYTLVQDRCGQNSSNNATFRVITENVPCGTTGTTCSKTIKIFFGTDELILSEEHHELIQRGEGNHPLPYRIRYMGIYLVIETYNGLVILWDKKTSLFIKLSADFKGQVCGLCGNYDGSGVNDFTTRSQSVVGNVLEFGNSWKVSPTCPDAKCTKDPCAKNPYRKSWSQKQCSIINSKTFATCHSHVDPTKYYEACVTDSCACDAGGDCECFCTAVAAYAQACSEFGVCVTWRSPSICPLFCDYYNAEGECDWHYKPCGAPCMKTCRNPSGRCLHHLPGLEGCYPYCPPEKPYFSEDEMRCVSVCGCYDGQGDYYPPGTIFDSKKTCQTCQCTNKGMECSYDPKACYCYYEGKTYTYRDVIYNTTDGLGWCMIATCDVNGTINREVYKCAGTTATTPFTFTTVSTTTSTTTPITTSCVHIECEWTEWYDVSYPSYDKNNGDYETPENIRNQGYNFCKIPDEVECRAQRFPNEKLEALNQKITCSKTSGLICNNKDQFPPICNNYEIRFLCCEYTPCSVVTTVPSTSTTAETTPAYKTISTTSITGTTPVPSVSTTIHSTTVVSTTPIITASVSTPGTTPGKGSTVTATSLQSTPISKPTETIPTSGKTPGIPRTTTTMLPPSSSTTICQRQCQWTPWFDNHYPSSDPKDGDKENHETIRAAGGQLCDNPQDIQCIAEDYSDVSLEDLGQKLQCNLNTGLLCENSQQTGKVKWCYNYKTRYLCCNDSHCKPATTPAGSTTAATTPVVSTTLGKSTLPASSAGSTPLPPVPTTTQSTTVVSTTPIVTASVSTPKTTPGKSTTVTATSLQSTPISKPTATIPTSGKTPGIPGTTITALPPSSTLGTTPGKGSTAIATSQQSTPISKPTATIPTSGKTPGIPGTTTTALLPSSSTTTCQPICEWTPWFDNHYPSSDPKDGDKENHETIQAAGGQLCDKPMDIECRSEDHPDISLKEIGQNVQCNLDTGLWCQNSEQTGKMDQCYNYQTRYLCCDDSHCNPATTPAGSTTAATTPVVSTTLGKSTLPASSVGSTPLPPVSTTTQSTTVVSTTAIVTASVSTPGTTPGKGSTVTATSLQSTPISKPTATIPTSGKTPGIPGTTTTALPPSNTPGTTPGKGSTVTATSLKSTPISKPTATIPTSGKTPGIPRTTTTMLPPSSSTTICQPQCQWTPWFDNHYPSSDPKDGDKENHETILAAGGQLCDNPQDIQCIAEDYSDVSLEDLGQKLQCNLNTGLLCENSQQTGKVKWCYNYKTRYLCCNDSHCKPATTPAGSTTAATTPVVSTTLGKSTLPASSAGSTPLPPVPTTTQSTTVVSTTPIVTASVSTPKTTPGKSTTVTATSLQSTPISKPTATIPTSGKTPGISGTTTTALPPSSTLGTTPGKGSTAIATSQQSTPISKPTATIPTSVKTPGIPGTTTTALPTSSSTTTCQPICEWTPWFDNHYPSSDPKDGDKENHETIQAAGGQLCDKPMDIECRSEDHPDISLKEIGQNVQCNLDTGLWCQNSEQTGKMDQCYNYQTRYLCCDDSHCNPATTPAGSTTAATTPVVSTTLGKSTLPASSVGSTPLPPVSTTTQSTTVVSTTAIVTASVSTPGTTPGKGSTVTATSLQSTPISKPTATIPTSGKTPGIPGTTTTALPPSNTPGTTPGKGSTAIATSQQSTPISKPTATIPTSVKTPGIPGTTTTALPTSSSTTTCQPICEWTPWFDNHYPSSDPKDGDKENHETIQAAGGQLCDKPMDIECRSEDHPDISLKEIGQNVQCNLDTGLWCQNSEQTGKMDQCYNYQTRYLCCDDSHCNPATTPAGSTTAATTPVVSTTLGKSTLPASSVGSTPLPPVSTTTQSTTVVSTTAIVTASVSTPGTTPGKGSTVTATSLQSTPISKPTATIPTSGKTPGIPGTTTTALPPSNTPGTTPGKGSTVTATSLKSTPISKPTETIPTSGKTPGIPRTTTTMLPPSSSTTICQRQCQWTPWFDNHYPSSDPKDGDKENHETIRAAGGQLCDNPQDIQCIAEDYSDVSLEDLGQKLQCNLNTGLLCENSQQTGKVKWCYNYKTRYLCCNDSHCKPATTPAGSTTAATTPVVSTTLGKSTLPASSVGSTPLPPVSTTTQSTTVVSTTPIVTASVSTPKTTPGKSTTVTATSLQSTPISKPTAIIPTSGKTPGISGTTTTALPPSSTLGTTPGKGSTAIATSQQSTPISKPTATIPTSVKTPGIPGTTTTALPTSSSTTTCQPICEWTPWFDNHYPSSDPKDGDKENHETIQAAGGQLCDKPMYIECRSEDHPDISLKDIGQNVQCNLDTGLWCQNSEQTGKMDQCYNYQTRYLCCDDSHCKPATTPAGSTTAATTPVVSTTLGKSTLPASSVGSTSLPPVSTTTQSTTVVSTTATVTASVSTPGTTPGKGSTVTATSLKSTPISKPTATNPTSGKTPGIPGTTTTSLPPSSTPGTTPGKGSTVTATSLKSTPISNPTATIPTSGKTPEIPRTTTTMLPPSSSTTICQPQCQWTPWFDNHYPSSDPKDGDKENHETILAAGGQLCDNPQDIQCIAEDYSDVSLEDLGQKLQCNLNTGLLCENSQQTGKVKWCYNYKTRYLCCNDSHCKPATTPAGSTTAGTTPVVSTTLGKSTLPASSAGSTPLPPVPTTTQSTTVVSTTPIVTASVSTPRTTPEESSTVTATSLQSTPISKPTATIPTSGKTPGIPGTTATALPPSSTLGTTPGKGSTAIATSQQSTPISKPTATIPTSGKTPGIPGTTTTALPTSSSTTTCQPKCEWTPWFDNHYPSSDPKDGDKENHETIQAAGGQLCDKPMYIECRSEDHPDISLKDIGQNVQCNLDTGLWCQNSEQTGKMDQCYNYQTRYLCCDDSHCNPATTPAGSTTAATMPLVSTTLGKSTLPASSVGSTPLPPVSTTTQSTTVVSTTAIVTASVSTPGTTPGKGSTVTATSLQSTPISKPTATIPTSGKTPGIPGTTTSSLPPSSTPGTTPGKGSTVTATSLKSTPISKPTATIPTSGKTPGIPRTTTITLPPSSSKSTPRTSSQTTVTISIASSSSSFTTASTSSITPTMGITTVTLSRTTPCFCHVSGVKASLYSPGDIIYNRTDSAGCSFYAICNKNCEIERHQGPCPSTPPPQPSSPVPTTSEVPGCLDIDPPRQINETWMLSNCTMATCEGNNRIVLIPQPPPEKIECASGLEPVKIEDQDGCPHYECECICTGWDNHHYMTFDGTYYSFHDNCTYILVKEIVNKHGNFSVLVDNYFCDPTNDQSCSRAIIINYNSAKITLSSHVHNGERTNMILSDDKPVYCVYCEIDGIMITNTNTMVAQIPAIGAFVTFNGLSFSVELPYGMFEHNTEGQCGTCSNDQSDDCRLPSGHDASSCLEMAIEWQVYDENKPYCERVVPTPPPTPVSPTPTICTTPSPLCELIVSDIFADCHKVLPPRVFYEDCLLEACHSANDSLSCYYLEMYASLCTAKGACTDWRGKTEGKCPYNCPKDKVYDACGTVPAATCSDGPAEDTSVHVSEGCFCSDDKILFNSYTDICVSECGCVGPDGLPKLPGSTWKSNCQECICDPLSVTVQCKPQTCETTETPVCEKEGFIAVPVVTPEDPCCPEMQCKCDTSACSNQKKTCEPGYELASVLFEGDCCVTFTCEQIPNICLVNETVYKPGTTVPGKACETCICGDDTDPATKRNVVECTAVPCDTTCTEGHEYQVNAGECCGKCVQVACVITLNDTVELLKPGDIWHPETNNCTFYECEEISDTLVLVNTVRKCPTFDPKECGPVGVKLTSDGCCQECKPQPPSCKLHKNQTFVRSDDCISTEVVEMTYCEGVCPSSAVYSNEAREMQHKCTCCQELKSHRRELTLTCRDGRSINYDYIYVDECQCTTACIPQTTVS
ncbi:mucin-5B-like [Anolis sagrei]|uniref:mucin-5B-like n=1 Tax=Anolis sagrei TaxID=38937 RepID=UPI003520F606